MLFIILIIILVIVILGIESNTTIRSKGSRTSW